MQMKVQNHVSKRYIKIRQCGERWGEELQKAGEGASLRSIIQCGEGTSPALRRESKVGERSAAVVNCKLYVT